MREKIYIVPGESHLQRYWPDLAQSPRPFDPDRVPEEKLAGGIDCWLMHTWARLCAANPSFEPVLAGQAPEGEVCLFHYDTALPRWGVHRCFSVVVQADRPRPPLADMIIFQNTVNAETSRRKNIHVWPQPGLVPRDASRGDAILNLAYLGNEQYAPAFLREADFQEGLRALGVTFECRFLGNWGDYRNVDLTVAIRNSPPAVLATKPANKLVNAWMAGSPALLGPEPGYRCLRESPLDYIEINNGKDVLDAVARLRADPALYAAMRLNGEKRRAAFSAQVTTQKWIETLELALERNRALKRRSPLARLAAYRVMRLTRSLQAKMSGWKD